MTRIITEQEVREALRAGDAIAKDREFALSTLEALRHWLTLPADVRAEWGGDAYIRDLCDDLESALSGWPVPITKEELCRP